MKSKLPELGVATSEYYEIASTAGLRPRPKLPRGTADKPIWHVKAGNVKGFYRACNHTLQPVRIITGEEAQQYL